MTSSARSLILHAGLPKTGTSSLQQWFYRQRAKLRASGLDYPDPLGQTENKHSFIVPELRKTETSRTLQEILDGATHPRLLLSNEGLANHFHDFSEAALKAFRGMTSAYTVEVILMTRNRTDWLKSYHKQCVLNPNIGASDLWGTDLTVEEISKHYRVTRLLDKSRLLADLGKGFGAARVHHVEYDQAKWVEEVMQILGVDNLRNRALPRINTSLPDWCIEWLRHVNSIYPDQQDRALWKHFFRIFLNINNSELVRSTERLGKGHFITVDLQLLPTLEQKVMESSDLQSRDIRANIQRFTDFVRSEVTDGAIMLK